MAHYTVKSDFCRKHAAEVAALASIGFLTSQVTGSIFGNTWRLTPKGLAHLHGN